MTLTEKYILALVMDSSIETFSLKVTFIKSYRLFHKHL